MKSERLKEYLIQIAENVGENTKIEDIYEHLALLADIDASEEEEMRGEILTQEEAEKKAKEWLK